MAAKSYVAYWTGWGRRGWKAQLYITVVFSQGRKTALEPVLNGFARRACLIRVKEISLYSKVEKSHIFGARGKQRSAG
jgi:hypothetical protein